MRDHTFYVVCSYAMMAFAIALELFLTVRSRRRVRARAAGDNKY